MGRKLFLLSSLVWMLVAGGCGAMAQQVANDANPLYRPTVIQLHTISVPPIDGLPFSATAIIENRQIMQDGTVAESRNLNLIGRDSRGRTHGEMRARVPMSSKDTPHLGEVTLYDPRTGTRTVCNTDTHIAVRTHTFMPVRMANTAPANVPGVTVEDLGTSTVNNIDVRGTRRSVVIPAANNSTGAAITVVDEYWYSEDLHLDILLLHNDPRTGEQKIALINLQRAEPPPAFFEVPEGYKIVDMTPPPGAPALQRMTPSPATSR
jgi:hypothetical protein